MTGNSHSFRFRLAAVVLGIGLGGFFDGILLHQILQWHHLLSALETDGVMDLRWQIVADGVFHALMYVLAMTGFLLLVRSRHELSAASAPRALSRFVLTGFGAWHVLDAVLSHWLLGIHRVRMDTDFPLLWDLGWLTLFGLAPLVIAIALGRDQGATRPPGTGSSALALLLATGALVTAGGVWSAWPSPTDTVTVVLRPGTTAAQLLNALQPHAGRVLWSDARGQVWILDVPRAHSWSLYRHGALYVGGSLGAPACAQWTRSGVRDS